MSLRCRAVGRKVSDVGPSGSSVVFVVVMLLFVKSRHCCLPSCSPSQDVCIYPTTRAGDSGGQTLNTGDNPNVLRVLGCS